MRDVVKQRRHIFHVESSVPTATCLRADFQAHRPADRTNAAPCEQPEGRRTSGEPRDVASERPVKPCESVRVVSASRSRSSVVEIGRRKEHGFGDVRAGQNGIEAPSHLLAVRFERGGEVALVWPWRVECLTQGKRGCVGEERGAQDNET